MARKLRQKLRARRKTEVLYVDDDAPTTRMQIPPGGWDVDDFEQRDTIPGLTFTDPSKKAAN